MTIKTIDAVQCRRWGSCYSDESLQRLYDRRMTPLEVCTRQDGEWADVPPQDRLWTVFHEGVMPDATLRLLACDFAERALTREREAGRKPDQRSWNAIAVARLFAVGEAAKSELVVASDAANDAVCAAAYTAANDALARAAAYTAARAAADAADAAEAYVVARAAANDAAYIAVHDAERGWQLNRVIKALKRQ